MLPGAINLKRDVSDTTNLPSITPLLKAASSINKKSSRVIDESDIPNYASPNKTEKKSMEQVDEADDEDTLRKKIRERIDT